MRKFLLKEPAQSGERRDRMRFWKRKRRTAPTEVERASTKPGSGKPFAMEVKLLAARDREPGLEARAGSRREFIAARRRAVIDMLMRYKILN